MIPVLRLYLPHAKSSRASEPQHHEYDRVLHLPAQLPMLLQLVPLEHARPKLEEELKVLLPLPFPLLLCPHVLGLVLGDDAEAHSGFALGWWR